MILVDDGAAFLLHTVGQLTSNQQYSHLGDGALSAFSEW